MHMNDLFASSSSSSSSSSSGGDRGNNGGSGRVSESSSDAGGGAMPSGTQNGERESVDNMRGGGGDGGGEQSGEEQLEAFVVAMEQDIMERMHNTRNRLVEVRSTTSFAPHTSSDSCLLHTYSSPIAMFPTPLISHVPS
jgi:hypothetical protein